MEIRCPFLKDQKVAFCKAFPIRKMLPFNQLYLEDDLCSKEAHTQCSMYQDKRESGSVSKNNKVCPFWEVEEVLYCGVYPVKKMIPSSAFKLECPCTTEAYIDCPAYRQIAQGDISPASGKVTVRSFLLDDTVYYHRGHLWVQQVNGKVRVGLDDFGRWLLGEVEKVTFPHRRSRVYSGQPLVRIRCAQGTAEIASPLSGTVVGVNEGVCQNSSLISADPYGQGWLVELRLAKNEIDRLEQQGEGFFSAPDARRWLEDEVDRLHGILATEIGVTMSDGGELLSSVQEAIDPRQWGILIETFLERRNEPC